MTGALAIRDLTVRYGTRKVLDGLTLPDLRPGELTLLLGPNAAGKSTLLRAIAGMQASQGEILLDGAPLARLGATARAGKIGYMPQNVPSGAAMTVLDSVIAALRAGGPVTGDPAEVALRALDRFGIAGRGEMRLDSLSGGQRQLTSLAQTIVRNPPVLILDEPTSALDLAHSHMMMDEMRRLAREGHVVLAVLHDLVLSAQWADRLLVVNDGRLHSTGTPQEVLTERMLAEVYGVTARVERASCGRPMVLVDGRAMSPAAAAR